MNRDRSNYRSMNEPVFSSIKRTLGAAVRARHWCWSSVKQFSKPPSTTSTGASEIREINRRVPKLQSRHDSYPSNLLDTPDRSKRCLDGLQGAACSRAV